MANYNRRYEYDDDKIKEMLKDDKPITYIANHFGIPYQAMSQHIRKTLKISTNKDAKKKKRNKQAQDKMIKNMIDKGYRVVDSKEEFVRILQGYRIRRELANDDSI